VKGAKDHTAAVARGHLGGLATHARYGTNAVVGRALAGKREWLRRLALEAAHGAPLTELELEAGMARALRQHLMRAAARSADAKRRRAAG
jgi:hypothetical protein